MVFKPIASILPVAKGDVLVVWKLDRLSRSLRDALTIMERLAEAKCGFRSLTEGKCCNCPVVFYLLRRLLHLTGNDAQSQSSQQH